MFHQNIIEFIENVGSGYYLPSTMLLSFLRSLPATLTCHNTIAVLEIFKTFIIVIISPWKAIRHLHGICRDVGLWRRHISGTGRATLANWLL